MVPNLSGRTKDLIGNWKFVYISDQESDFIPFTISFNLKNVLRVRRSNCLDNKVLKWKGYDHNINIWEEKDEVSEMEIKNLQEDEECIK